MTSGCARRWLRVAIAVLSASSFEKRRKGSSMEQIEQTTPSCHIVAHGRGFGARMPGKRAMTVYANVVHFSWPIPPGFYLVLSPANPRGQPSTRYVGPFSSSTAAKLLQVSALAFGLADHEFQHS